LADAGAIYFQDEASQLVAAVAGRGPSGRFLDVCAAPGGKTTAIATKAENALIVAGDITDRRVRLLRETCVKQGLERINIVQYDAAYSLPFTDETFEVVFVDAPCTGTGTIRHNPELRYFVEPSDMNRLPEIQLAILANAAKAVKPGGRLIYATCSLEPEENEQVVRAFLDAHARFRAVAPAVPESFLTPDGYARTRPDRDQTDGFFIASFTPE
jgi:16S rRNA (cytosine967-C5)-methyltransferase